MTSGGGMGAGETCLNERFFFTVTGLAWVVGAERLTGRVCSVNLVSGAMRTDLRCANSADGFRLLSFCPCLSAGDSGRASCEAGTCLGTALDLGAVKDTRRLTFVVPGADSGGNGVEGELFFPEPDAVRTRAPAVGVALAARSISPWS